MYFSSRTGTAPFRLLVYWRMRRLVSTAIFALLAVGCTGGSQPPAASTVASEPPRQQGHPTPEKTNRIAASCVRHGNTDIYVRTLGTRRMVRLTRDPAKDGEPAFSPDMASIAFARHFDVWVMAADGRQERDLTPLAGQQTDPAWSQDGSQIAYSSTGADVSPGGIWIMDADGSDQHVVPNTKGGAWPSWSPDGKNIMFSSPPRGYSLYTVSPDGSNLQLLRKPRGSRAEDFEPAWSPDGSHVAFIEVSETGEQSGIIQLSGASARLETFFRPIANVFVIRRDGTGLRRITNDRGLDADPSWSPNSKKIAYGRGPGPTLSPPGRGIKIVGLSTHRSAYFVQGDCSQPSWG
jgi:Tol biopolymer transport system component